MAKFDPYNKDDIAQLNSALGYSRGRLKIFRDNNLELLKQSVGAHYSESGAEDRVPINLIELAMNIYLQRLVAKNPAVSITTDYKQLKEISTRFELGGNHLIKEIALGKTLESVVNSAMLSKGIIKIGLNSSNIEVGGVLHDSGQAFADHVAIDDWVEDMTANTNENGQFEGNYWYPTIDEAEKLFPGKNLNPRKDQPVTTDDAHQISEGIPSQREEFRETVRLLDVYLKKQNLILQCSTSDYNDNENGGGPIDEVLKVIEWTGPEGGPYRKLGFSTIENNTMPVSPGMHWKDIHLIVNKLFRKLGRQADSQKTVTGIRAGADADGNRILDANDGDMIKLDDPRNIVKMDSGGINPQSLAFVMWLKDIFSYLAGNLDMLGGLGPQSETLGQDQLLSASASMRIQKMQKEVTEFTTKVLEDLMFYLWYDPNPKQRDVLKKAPGFESIAISVPFNPEDREGDYLQYNIKIEPFSMQHQSPEAKLQGIRTILMEMVQPLLPIMQEQGATIDVEELFKTVSKLSNIPEIKNIIKFTTPQLQSEPVGQSSQGNSAKPAVTTRRYERINRPGATDKGKSAIMQQALLGANPQKSEVASLSRASA